MLCEILNITYVEQTCNKIKLILKDRGIYTLFAWNVQAFFFRNVISSIVFAAYTLQ